MRGVRWIIWVGVFLAHVCPGVTSLSMAYHSWIPSIRRHLSSLTCLEWVQALMAIFGHEHGHGHDHGCSHGHEHNHGEYQVRGSVNLFVLPHLGHPSSFALTRTGVETDHVECRTRFD